MEKVCPDLYAPSVGKEVVTAFYVFHGNVCNFIVFCINACIYTDMLHNTCLCIGDVIVFSSENNCMTNMEGDYVFLLGALCLHFIDLYNLGFVAVG